MALTPVSVALAGVRRLGMDTAPLIYYVEYHPVFGLTCKAVFDGVGSNYTLLVSSICYTETLVVPLRNGDKRLKRAYNNILMRTAHIATRPVTRPVAQRAADLRARYNLRMADALQVATAWVNQCDAFLTNDATLQRVQEVPVLLVSDMRA